jgi:hypothetical protein
VWRRGVTEGRRSGVRVASVGAGVRFDGHSCGQVLACLEQSGREVDATDLYRSAVASGIFAHWSLDRWDPLTLEARVGSVDTEGSTGGIR